MSIAHMHAVEVEAGMEPDLAQAVAELSIQDTKDTRHIIEHLPPVPTNLPTPLRIDKKPQLA